MSIGPSAAARTPRQHHRRSLRGHQGDDAARQPRLERERAASGGYFISLEKPAADKLRSRVVLCIGLSYTSGQRG
jgi:hypothetical protein